MINNKLSLTGVVIQTYEQHTFENKLKIFEIEVEMSDLKTVVLPVLYGSFTTGSFKKGDKIIVDGVVDVVDKKTCCIASIIYNLSDYGRKRNNKRQK